MYFIDWYNRSYSFFDRTFVLFVLMIHCILVNFSCFLSSADFFKIIFSKE